MRMLPAHERFSSNYGARMDIYLRLIMNDELLPGDCLQQFLSASAHGTVERANFFKIALVIEGALNDCSDFPQFKRLSYVIKRARPHCVDGAFDRSLPANDHDN